MSYVSRYIVLVAVVASLFTFAGHAQPAHAECAIASATNPPSRQFYVNMIAGHTYKFVTTGFTGKTTIYPNWSPAGYAPWGVSPNSTSTLFDESAGCASQAVTWFNPGDLRLHPEPGDRLVVYCNNNSQVKWPNIPVEPNIDIWVIDNSSVGHELMDFPGYALQANNLVSGISFPLGENGLLYMEYIPGGLGNVNLQGGQYGATGQGEWAKEFFCLL